MALGAGEAALLRFPGGPLISLETLGSAVTMPPGDPHMAPVTPPASPRTGFLGSQDGPTPRTPAKLGRVLQVIIIELISVTLSLSHCCD